MPVQVGGPPPRYPNKGNGPMSPQQSGMYPPGGAPPRVPMQYQQQPGRSRALSLASQIGQNSGKLTRIIFSHSRDDGWATATNVCRSAADGRGAGTVVSVIKAYIYTNKSVFLVSQTKVNIQSMSLVVFFFSSRPSTSAVRWSQDTEAPRKHTARLVVSSICKHPFVRMEGDRIGGSIDGNAVGRLTRLDVVL